MMYYPLHEFLVKTNSHDRKILKLLFDLEGVLFGGYIRDIIANTEPKDFDICLPKHTINQFINNI